VRSGRSCFAIARMTISPGAAGMAQTPMEDARCRFDLAQAAGPEDAGLITSVRLQVARVAYEG